jgi:hypothetical protein
MDDSAGCLDQERPDWPPRGKSCVFLYPVRRGWRDPNEETRTPVIRAPSFPPLRAGACDRVGKSKQEFDGGATGLWPLCASSRTRSGRRTCLSADFSVSAASRRRRTTCTAVLPEPPRTFPASGCWESCARFQRARCRPGRALLLPQYVLGSAFSARTITATALRLPSLWSPQNGVLGPADPRILSVR